MSKKPPASLLNPRRSTSLKLDKRLATYFAASSAAGAALASDAQAAIVANTTVQPFGINGAVPIDFNSDGQVDFEIDHDRVDLGGGNVVDYLQLDKNDINGAPPAENPLPIDAFDTFPLNGTDPNDTFEAAYVVPVGQGDYPAALLPGAEIGSLSTWDFQEGDNFGGTGRTIRANRLIDEDATQVDKALGGLNDNLVYVPTNGPGFLGLGGQVRYLGVKMDFQNLHSVHYGWIGIRITNEADATGEVVGWAYETQANTSILAGDTGAPPTIPGDFNMDGTVDAADYVYWRKTDSGNVSAYAQWKSYFGQSSSGAGGIGVDSSAQAAPEPGSLLLGFGAALAIIGSFLFRRIRWS